MNVATYRTETASDKADWAFLSNNDELGASDRD